VKTQIRATQLRFVEKAAPDLEEKPPPVPSKKNEKKLILKKIIN
jgi:hypothetical protein